MELTSKGILKVFVSHPEQIPQFSAEEGNGTSGLDGMASEQVLL